MTETAEGGVMAEAQEKVWEVRHSPDVGWNVSDWIGDVAEHHWYMIFPSNAYELAEYLNALGKTVTTAVEVQLAMTMRAIERTEALITRTTLLRQAMEAAIHHDPEEGLWTDCGLCGMRTWHEKDGEVTHEPDCVYPAIASALEGEPT